MILTVRSHCFNPKALVSSLFTSEQGCGDQGECGRVCTPTLECGIDVAAGEQRKAGLRYTELGHHGGGGGKWAGGGREAQ